MWTILFIVYMMGAIYTMVHATVVVIRTPHQPWIMALFVVLSGIFWWVFLLATLFINNGKAENRYD